MYIFKVQRVPQNVIDKSSLRYHYVHFTLTLDNRTVLCACVDVNLLKKRVPAVMESLRNKVVIITGASTGIGAFTARYLSPYKPKLVLLARSPDKLKAVQKQCEDAGAGQGNVLTLTVDLTNLEGLESVIQQTVDAFGQVDVLVNNAAALALCDVQHTTPATFDRVMAVNIRTPFFLSKAAIPHLKKSKGSIINISSAAGQKASEVCAPYGISKAALEHFTRILAYEVSTFKVRVNALTLGVVDTDTKLELLGGMPAKDMTHIQPLGGACSMEDVAKVVAFLASDLSSAITGACIPIDRGLMIVPPNMGLSESRLNIGDLNIMSTQDIFAHIASVRKTPGPK